MSHMKPHNEVGTPSPEQLAAYADGELDWSSRAQVQAWLLVHPEAAAEVESLRELAQLCRATVPAEPDAAAWASSLDNIERQAAGQRQHRRRALGLVARLIRAIVPLAGAAAVLFVLWLHQPGQRDMPPGTEQPEPFPVASADDVDIISMDDADRQTLVVGKPPLSEPIVLVGPGDMTDIDIKPDQDGMVPTRARLADGGSTVMLVAPLGWSGVDPE
jgi:hypothetical protein